MHDTSHAQILGLIDVLKSVYKNQIDELTRKIENIEYINTTVLINKIEKEIPAEDIPANTEKIISIIESVIQD